MEELWNGLTLEIPEGCFPLSTDSMALADFAKLPRAAQVLDLGSGCGTLGILLCGKSKDCQVVGVEAASSGHQAALQNIERNGLSQRMKSIRADIRSISQLLPPGSFHCCISNPPYFTGGPDSKLCSEARKEQGFTLENLFKAASGALRYGGDLFLVHRPERLAEICSTASKFKLEPKVLRLLRHRENGPVSLILIQCRKGGKPGLLWEEKSLRDASGRETPFYQSLYHP